MHLELWLTTLITISPQQEDIDLQQLKPSQLLDLLSSGNVWVCRGSGSHIELLITVREEPLAHKQLQDLVESILQAPVWEQLLLQPSLPSDIVLEPGILHLNINHATHNGWQEEQPRHRIHSKVPGADVRPPEGFPIVSLHSVRLRMDILETKHPPRTINRKSKTLTKKGIVLNPETRRKEPSERGESDDILHESNAVSNVLQTNHVSPQVGPPVARKRKRKVTNAIVRTISSLTPRPDLSSGTRRQPATISDLQPSTLVSSTVFSRKEIESMVDGALRFSVCGSFSNRSRSGLKVKASTFVQGLADVAPVMWRPGYLPALSQRAHLLPTISRSLSQMAYVRATSSSIKDTMFRLTTTPTNCLVKISNHLDSVVEQDVGRLTSSIAGRLWLHLQNTITSKSTLQAFVTSSSNPAAHSDSDDMLEEVRQRQKHRHTTGLGDEDDEDFDLLDDESLLHETLYSTTEIEEGVLNKSAVESSGIETEDNLSLDAVHLGIKPPNTPFINNKFASVYPESSYVSVSNSTLPKLQYGPCSNRTAEKHLTAASPQSLPVLAKTESSQDSLLLSACEEPVRTVSLWF
ncbi:Nn.00g063450.m01.CDS01 [Neocucurbitaria sp. VM-36]